MSSFFDEDAFAAAGEKQQEAIVEDLFAVKFCFGSEPERTIVVAMILLFVQPIK